MNNKDHYVEKWQAKRKEYDAKAERLDAEAHLRYDEWSGNMQGQVNAMGDWTEAAWDEFTAKIEQQWHDMFDNSTKDDFKE